MSIGDYAHWNEEAPLVWAAENDFDSPLCDESDDEIKRRVYEQTKFCYIGLRTKA
jgi:hypothetical protein